MFAKIDLKNAQTIAICIPPEAASTAMPALIRMFEENAVFIANPYADKQIVKPEITFHCFNELEIDRNGDTIMIGTKEPGNVAVPGDDWQLATPDVFVSNKKRVAALEEQIGQYRTEIAFLKQQLEAAKAKLEHGEQA